MNNSKTKKLTTLAMFVALAFAAVALGRIPLVLFLKYDPKDVIIAISGFVYGPLSCIYCVGGGFIYRNGYNQSRRNNWIFYECSFKFCIYSDSSTYL